LEQRVLCDNEIVGPRRQEGEADGMADSRGWRNFSVDLHSGGVRLLYHQLSCW
jgi:hypothetical protein